MVRVKKVRKENIELEKNGIIPKSVELDACILEK